MPKDKLVDDHASHLHAEMKVPPPGLSQAPSLSARLLVCAPLYCRYSTRCSSSRTGTSSMSRCTCMHKHKHDRGGSITRRRFSGPQQYDTHILEHHLAAGCCWAHDRSIRASIQPDRPTLWCSPRFHPSQPWIPQYSSLFKHSWSLFLPVSSGGPSALSRSRPNPVSLSRLVETRLAPLSSFLSAVLRYKDSASGNKEPPS